MAVTRGTSDVFIAPIASDGGVGTAWASIGAIYADETAALAQADPTTKEFKSIQSDQPLDKDITQGAITVQLSLMNVTVDDLLLLMGGTVTGTTEANKVWSAPLQAVTIEKSLKIVPKKGKIITFVRMQLSSKSSFNLQPDGLYLVQVLCSVLQPTKPNTLPYTFGPDVSTLVA
jgi:hypothetical protein